MPVLDWIGKNKVINHDKEVPFKVLNAQYTYDENGRHEGAATSENMIIHGDNLMALKALLPKYQGKIKCIYIDPPYNTGNEGWVYNDRVNDPQIKKWLGEVVGKEGDDLSRHDKWLCMMYPRLKLLYTLLSEDGAIFISIDDNEQANLKQVCDELFGTNNFVACIANISNPKGRSDQKSIANAHEYILMYKKSEGFAGGGFVAGENITKRYNKIDNSGKKWREIDLRKTGSNDLRSDRPNMFYPIYWDEIHRKIEFEKGEGLREIFPYKSKDEEGCWRWEKATAIKNRDRLFARYMPQKKQWSVFEKDYFDESERIKPVSAWMFKDINSERGSEMFVDLGFRKNDFPNPKPVGTIERILQIATDKNSIVLDSFAGSGTTAQAVLNINQEDGGKRKFILVEMMDYAEPITAERVKRVIQGRNKDRKIILGTGGSFTYYEIGDALFDEEGNLNSAVNIKKIREYIWYTETREALPEPVSEDSAFLGRWENSAYYFYYNPQGVTVLDEEFLATITAMAESYVIYADLCTLDEAFMTRHHIIFKKIPRDIERL